jgi:hypothetical protein
MSALGVKADKAATPFGSAFDPRRMCGLVELSILSLKQRRGRIENKHQRVR